MTKEDTQRIWLLSGTGFLAFVTVVAISIYMMTAGDYPPFLLPLIGSFVIFLFDIALLSCAATSSRVLLFFGRLFLWLGLLSFFSAIACGVLNMMGII